MLTGIWATLAWFVRLQFPIISSYYVLCAFKVLKCNFELYLMAQWKYNVSELFFFFW